MSSAAVGNYYSALDNFFDLSHGQSPGWQASLPFSGRLPATVLSSAACLMEIRAQAERDSGIDLKPFVFIAESVFTFIPESCSRSPRNGVRNHPGIAFTFPRIPQINRQLRSRERATMTRRYLSVIEHRTSSERFADPVLVFCNPEAKRSRLDTMC